MLIHGKQIIRVNKMLCTCMHVERKHSSSVSVFELHSSKMSLLVNGCKHFSRWHEAHFRLAKKLCVYCRSVHTEPP